MKPGSKEEALRRQREARFAERVEGKRAVRPAVALPELEAAIEVIEWQPTKSKASPREAQMKALREGRARGRPRVVEDGVRLHIVLPQGLLERVDGVAGARGLTRTAAIRALLEEALKP